MILKGNIRAAGQELASHLLNSRDNDRVEVAEIYGFAGEDLHRAFAEAEAIASATNCEKYLYSLSINPSEPMTREQYQTAIDAIGKKLGLADQPRAVVFHVKEGREHCHVAWSRIDTERMQAVHNAFDRQKLREQARELCLEFGHKLPPHLQFDRGTERHKDKDKTQAEIAQEKRTGETTELRREKVTEAYKQADNLQSFKSALSEHDYILAKGDKAPFVIVDKACEAHSLTRQIEGVKAKEIRAKFDLKNAELPSVQQAKEQHAENAREKVAEQSRPKIDHIDVRNAQEALRDAAEQYQRADEYLTALRDAHMAEVKAEKGHYQDELKAIRERQAEEIATVKDAVKEAYRPEWRDLFKRQREEAEALKRVQGNEEQRLRGVLMGHDGHAFDFENRNTMAGVFNANQLHEMDAKKMAKRHEAEKAELGDMSKLAVNAEIKAIKEQADIDRKEAKRAHTEREMDMAHIHREDVKEATRARDMMAERATESLRYSQRLAEEQGLDLSGGEKSNRERPADRGEAKRGFNKSGFGKDDDELDLDEPERVLKPPGQSFTP